MSEKIPCPDCKGQGFYLKHEGRGYFRDGSFGHNEWADCEPCSGTGDERERIDFGRASLSSQGAPEAGAIELLPCPICGGEAGIKTPRYETVDGRAWFVGCVHRGNPPVHDTPTRESVFYAYGSTAEEAAAAWNRRAASPSPPPGVGECCRGLAPKSECKCEQERAPVGVEVVKLEWEREPNTVMRNVRAKTPFGAYCILVGDDGNGRIWCSPGQNINDLVGPVEELQASAQNHFNAAVRSTLVPSSLLKEAEEALRTALVAMTLAKALPGVADEYDFEPAIADVTAVLARLGAAP